MWLARMLNFKIYSSYQLPWRQPPAKLQKVDHDANGQAHQTHLVGFTAGSLDEQLSHKKTPPTFH